MFLQYLTYVGRAILGQSSRNGSSYGSVAYKPATMNDMPVPVGSWQNHYNANQRKYNTHLFSGIAFSLFTLVVVS